MNTDEEERRTESHAEGAEGAEAAEKSRMQEAVWTTDYTDLSAEGPAKADEHG